MVSLLSLPREIRDMILQLVLQHERAPPAGCERQLEGRVSILDVTSEAWALKKRVRYEPKTVQPTATTLMLVNRQLHAEVRDSVAWLQSREGRRCKVDVLLLDEKELWVTPLRTPACSPVLDQVDADMRVVGVLPDADRDAPRNIFDRGDGGPPGYVWPYYYALERFLQAGPTGRPASDSGNSVDRHMTVHRLVLNFVTPTPDEQHPLGSHGEKQRCLIARAIKSGATAAHMRARTKLLRPEWLAEELLHILESLIVGGKDGVTYARLVMERVGVIEAQVDGRHYKEIDVGATLRGMKLGCDPSWYRYQEEKKFYEAWRKKVFAARAAAGLN
ncbi:hypothetical protein PG996_004868 [Apiospora saccharicola]|uniref:Uncharacterized protein n=1 Tax=Apiospora saccharicola TaxID=335842 RepID=A0ABR1VJX8_9PEZI